MKRFLILISFMVIVFCSLGGIVYADDTSTVSTSTSDSSSINTTSSSTSRFMTSSTSGFVIGSSDFNIIVSHKKDDCFTALDELLDFELSSDFHTEKRLSLATDLKSLIVDVMSNGGYTFETFKSAFVQILQGYGVEVNDDFLYAIEQYSSYYFNDDFEQEDNEQLLVWIGGILGMMTTLFLTSQQGGVHRGY